MIRVDLWILPLLYAGVFLAAILALWLWSAWRQARRRSKERSTLCQCRLCAAWLRHEGSGPLLRCPTCGALNEPGLINDI
jgi:uncharacterized paraquat-inducible protein A